MNSPKEGYRFLPFFWKGKNILKILSKHKIRQTDYQHNNFETSNIYKIQIEIFACRFSGGTIF